MKKRFISKIKTNVDPEDSLIYEDMTEVRFKLNQIINKINSMEDDNSKEEIIESHLTEDEYCCACEYDIACMNEKIEIAIQKKVDEIKKSKTKIVGILFNAQNSPIEYSLQEIADKIIFFTRNC